MKCGNREKCRNRLWPWRSRVRIPSPTPTYGRGSTLVLQRCCGRASVRWTCPSGAEPAPPHRAPRLVAGQGPGAPGASASNPAAIKADVEKYGEEYLGSGGALIFSGSPTTPRSPAPEPRRLHRPRARSSERTPVADSVEGGVGPSSHERMNRGARWAPRRREIQVVGRSGQISLGKQETGKRRSQPRARGK
jgi:hypothetical protein